MKSWVTFALSLLLLTVWILGCSGMNATVVPANRDMFDNFKVNEIQEKKVGEILLTKIDGKFFHGYEIRNDYRSPDYNGNLASFGDKMQVIGTLDNGDFIGLVEGNFNYDSHTVDKVTLGCLVINRNSNQIYALMICNDFFKTNTNVFSGRVTNLASPSSTDTLKPIKIYAKGSHKTELVYTGKSGKIIKFQFREFSDNLRAPSNTQDLSFDLSESTDITVKNINIKVIEATNAKLKFKVVSAEGEPNVIKPEPTPRADLTEEPTEETVKKKPEPPSVANQNPPPPSTSMIVNEGKVTLRKNPSAKAAAIKTLKKGEEVQVIKQKDGWCLIELAGGETGWCLKSALVQKN